ncbi:MAG: Txe/YoeB family addiction module toxin [Gammaproteobacteria bacterium]|nr:Txe/YoeB family addiction module toxin [Gammaproteobacteria bacterium]
MNIAWTELAWDDYLYWQNTDKKKIQRINDLINDIQRTPFQGIGKPEPLRFDLAGKWSRRIDDEHRLVYEISGKKEKERNKMIDKRIIIIHLCRYHY